MDKTIWAGNEVTGQHMFPTTYATTTHLQRTTSLQRWILGSYWAKTHRTPTFFGRHVSSPDLLDVDVVKGWIRDCEEYHGDECNDSLVHPDLYGDRRATFRAIDVEEMCIATPPPDARYLALLVICGGKDSRSRSQIARICHASLSLALCPRRSCQRQSETPSD